MNPEDVDVEELIEEFGVDRDEAERIREVTRLKAEHEFTPTVEIEVPEAVAEYVLDAAQRNVEAAPESDYLDADTTIEEQMEMLLLDFLNPSYRWVLPDGTVIGPGAEEGDDEQ